MKHFVLFVLSILMLLTAPSLQAQKFEIGIDGGVGFNTAPAFSRDIVTNIQNERGSDATPTIGIKAVYVHHSWQYGINVAYRELSYKYNDIISGGDVFYIGSAPKVISPPVFLIPVKAELFSIPTKFFINRQFVFHHLETYTGISVGYVFMTTYKAYSPEEETHGKLHEHALSAGFQMGGTYFISKRFGINAEVNGDCIVFKEYSGNTRYFSFPATLGLRYRL